MPRAAVTYPTKDELRGMSVVQLNAYIRRLRDRLSYTHVGPVHKTLSKHLGVAEKVRELQRGREVAGDA